jgi:hypothetical protein
MDRDVGYLQSREKTKERGVEVLDKNPPIPHNKRKRIANCANRSVSGLYPLHSAVGNNVMNKL